ncbi:hypothetical protein [Bacteroides finegoldii]|uniref:hypothetical protein n=1 Tax=Bacteroides finegoldii TaxID=338188 RepID=UPI00189CB3B7|nr:hypothetical protein [Bacteroides finegoldii]
MKTSNHQSKLSIHCGSNTDSVETLEKICKEEAEKLAKTIELAEGDAISVPFWTPGPGFPELIGVGVFSKDETGKVVYELDFSESTL